LYTLKQIAALTGSRLEGNDDAIVNSFLTDSRNLRQPEGTLFIALKTGTNDGHRYVNELSELGVKAFVVEEGFDPAPYLKSGGSFLIVKNSLSALQHLAASHRRRFSIPVIGVTGSNGKTMVKEWLYHLLKPDYVICRSPKSYNSQLGVALSVLSLAAEHTLAIFEAGISRRGEMVTLEKMILPTIGILTSLGSAHDEGFASKEEKLQEKLHLFVHADKVVVNISPEVRVSVSDKTEVCTIGEAPGAGVPFRKTAKGFSLKWNGRELDFEIPFSDDASALNAATCAVTMLTLGYDAETIRLRLRTLPPLALRLETHKGILNAWIVSDYYNSDLDALGIALDFLKKQKSRDRKVVVLSDIEQSGMPAGDLYEKVSGLLSSHKINYLIGIGKEIGSQRGKFSVPAAFYDSTAAFVSDFANLRDKFRDSAVLLKGARSFGFERIDRLLQLKAHDTKFEINLEHLAANVNYYRRLTGSKVKFMCMVKATGYGSGAAEIASHLQHMGVDYLAVAYADEGVELREAKITLPVMVMNPEEGAMDDIITNRLEPEIYSLRVLEQFAAAADRAGIAEAYPVHIKIDTGMNRLGFNEIEAYHLAERLPQLRQLKVVSVFTHLAGSEDQRLDAFTRRQFSQFESISAALREKLGYNFIRHACNSAGISRFSEGHYEMVRLGIGMYGISSDEKEQKNLASAGILKTKISQIKTVEPGATVGYGRAGEVKWQTRVATIPIGYADGFSRALGRGRHGVYIKGSFCPTVGSVCMDMCMVDVTPVNCEEGDEVIVFENAAQLKALAKAMGTIPYEALTAVSGRVKRVYVEG
jgi:Alr-MurF fusion protein